MTLFANLTLEGMPELVPGRLFTTRCNHLLFFVGIGSADFNENITPDFIPEDDNDDRVAMMMKMITTMMPGCLATL